MIEHILLVLSNLIVMALIDITRVTPISNSKINHNHTIIVNKCPIVPTNFKNIK
jgi:hypothetical protein